MSVLVPFVTKMSFLKVLRKLKNKTDDVVKVGSKRKREEEEPVPVCIPSTPPDILSSYNVTELYRYPGEECGLPWKDWKQQQKLPSASMLASIFGLGYATFKDELQFVLGLKEKTTTTTIWTEKLMKHGIDNEPEARNMFLAEKKIPERNIMSKNVVSVVFDVDLVSTHTKFLATPDLLFITEEGELSVCEIKCPGYGIVVNKKDGKSIADLTVAFLDKYPHGKPQHFIQVATYAYLFKCRTFYLYYLFTDGINKYTIEFRYNLTQDVIAMVSDAIFRCSTYIDRYNVEMEQFGKCDFMNYPIRIAKKNQLDSIKRTIAGVDVLKYSCITNHCSWAELQKESPEESKQ